MSIGRLLLEGVVPPTAGLLSLIHYELHDSSNVTGSTPVPPSPKQVPCPIWLHRSMTPRNTIILYITTLTQDCSIASAVGLGGGGVLRRGILTRHLSAEGTIGRAGQPPGGAVTVARIRPNGCVGRRLAGGRVSGPEARLKGAEERVQRRTERVHLNRDDRASPGFWRRRHDSSNRHRRPR